MKFFNPLKNAKVTQPFGGNFNEWYRTHGLMGHSGVDIVTVWNDPIFHAKEGYVYKVVEDPDNVGQFRGVFVIYDGSEGTYEILYGHLNDVYSTEGTIVQVGDEVGTEGNTGNVWSSGQPVSVEERINGSKAGTHLHFQVREVKKVTTTLSTEHYLTYGNGLYKDKDGFYYHVPNFNNGYNGCISPEFNGIYAGDALNTVAILQTIVSLYEKILALLKIR